MSSSLESVNMVCSRTILISLSMSLHHQWLFVVINSGFVLMNHGVVLLLIVIRHLENFFLLRRVGRLEGYSVQTLLVSQFSLEFLNPFGWLRFGIRCGNVAPFTNKPIVLVWRFLHQNGRRLPESFIFCWILHLNVHRPSSMVRKPIWTCQRSIRLRNHFPSLRGII